MLFYLYAWLLPPGLFVVLLLLLAWWRRKQVGTVVLLIVLALTIYAASVPLVSSNLLKPLEYEYPLPPHPSGDVIVLLGGGVIRNVPAPAAWGGQLSDVMTQRLLAAVEVHRRVGAPVLVSGGEVFEGDGNEAQVARRVLLSLGLKESDIILEDKSLNTIENAVLTAKILKDRGFSRPILVTSAFHMPRSVENFRLAGIAVTAYPTGYYVSQTAQMRTLEFIPSYAAMRGTAVAMKEYMGLAAFRLKSALR